MTRLEFRQLPISLGYTDSLTFLREDVVVFDLRPANVVMTPNGILMPIDCIPARVHQEARLYLEALLD